MLTVFSFLEMPGPQCLPMKMSANENVLVTDFDGTMTQRDFFQCVIDELSRPEQLEPWRRYERGELSHFDALNEIFATIRAPLERIDQLLESMQFDTRAGVAVERLRHNGWDVQVVSNGCQWYIERIFDRHGLKLPVLSNPGQYDPNRGLVMQRPTDSPFYDPEVGIGKQHVIEDCLARYQTVAFAGDGRPDLSPALRVPPELRFARGFLAETLTRSGDTFHSFQHWSQIADGLVDPGHAGHAGHAGPVKDHDPS
jgi:2,3-diketo-5-methylthio-1-phosphopentane phosphatase